MAQENTISVTFSAAEQKTISDAISAIAGVLEGKAISLTAKERQQYGRVKYEKEIFVTNAQRLMTENPTLVPGWVDKPEYDRDYDAHHFLNAVIKQLEQELQKMQDTNLLLGYDLDTAARMFYMSVKTAAAANAPGARTVYETLKQQFPGSGSRNTGNMQAP